MSPSTAQPSVRRRGNTLRIALPEQPEVTWTIEVAWLGGQPHFLHLAYEATDRDRRPVAQQAQTFTVPWQRLVGVWRLEQNLHVDGTPRSEPGNLWEVLQPSEATSLGPKPRQRKDKTPETYHREMVEWSEPIAVVMEAARIGSLPIQQKVAERFGFSVDRAKQVIDIAREFHPHLPKQRRPGDSAPKTPDPTPGRGPIDDRKRK
jgi:hypothetical protein